MKYNFSGFTQKANEAINYAIESAEKMGHTYVGSEHLLIGISSITDATASRVLLSFGITSDKIIELVKQNIGYGNKTSLNPDMLTPRAKHIIELSVSFARDAGKSYVGTEHILIGILNDSENYAQKFISNFNCSASDLLTVTMSDGELKNDKLYKKENKKISKNKSQSLVEKYGKDLTEMAISGKLSKVIGRDEEIKRVMQILSRKTKNNPCLIGDPGVGKTAVVEGIAQIIANNCAPEHFKNKRIIEVDLTSIVAGTKYRGDFEERIKSIINEAINCSDIILFIDEIHTIVGAGSAEGSTDAANMLKPCLARGELQIIGATTISEYRKTIEKDAALDRRFQQVVIDEPTTEETVKILEGLIESYEAYHGVKISKDAINSAVNLSNRYITDRFLPDKAIDLIDEASSSLKLSKTNVSESSKELLNQLEEIVDNKNKAILIQDYENAALLRDNELKLREKIKIENEINKNLNPLIITSENISELVCKITKIPVKKLEETDSERLRKLKEKLNSSVIGQKEAINILSNAITRARTGIKDPRRPIGCYLFLGPTGVGKTELCKSLATNLFGDNNALIRLDMSEYSERHSVSKLIGSPPGYIGYESSGVLSDKIRRYPYSVVLFDEIEKAHSDIYNVLLQILDDGIITDSQGRQLNFKNAVIIMTSNIGSENLFGKNKIIGFHDSTVNSDIQIRGEIEEKLKDYFKPEFLNRIDEFVIFNILKNNDIKLICKKMLSEIANRLNEQNIKISFSDDVINQLVKEGYNEKYGARPLKRLIETKIGDKISELILDGELFENCSAEIDYVNQFVIKNIKKTKAE